MYINKIATELEILSKQGQFFDKVELAVAMAREKLKKTAYKDYRNNQALQKKLFANCLHEAKAQFEMWGACQ